MIQKENCCSLPHTLQPENQKEKYTQYPTIYRVWIPSTTETKKKKVAAQIQFVEAPTFIALLESAVALEKLICVMGNPILPELLIHYQNPIIVI